MSVCFQDRTLFIDGQPTDMPWKVLNAIEHRDKVFVLFDPDSYLLNQDYKMMRREGLPPIRNLVAYTRNGVKLWEAEFPESSDYYYQLISASPLVASSFSSYRCEIDPDSGKIKQKVFLK